MAPAAQHTTVDAYLEALPDDVRVRMTEIRRLVRSAVPDVAETISHQMPTYTLDGRLLLHVAAWKQHIGLYPLPPLDHELGREVAPYRGAEDTMRLPHAEPLPADVVERVVGVLLERRRAG